MTRDGCTLLAAAACAWLFASSGTIEAARPRPPDQIPRLIQKLQSATEWAKAWDELLAIGLPATGALKQCLQSDDGVLSVRSAALLYKMGSRTGVMTLVDKLNSDDFNVRSLAFSALQAIAGSDNGYDPAAPTRQREAAAQRWRRWAKDFLAKDPACDHAVVVAVDNAEAMVVLNVGRNNGVKADDLYTIVRGSEFVAVVKVLRVMPKLCVARVREGEIRLPMHLGDIALPFTDQ